MYTWCGENGYVNRICAASLLTPADGDTWTSSRQRRAYWWAPPPLSRCRDIVSITEKELDFQLNERPSWLFFSLFFSSSSSSLCSLVRGITREGICEYMLLNKNHLPRGNDSICLGPAHAVIDMRAQSVPPLLPHTVLDGYNGDREGASSCGKASNRILSSTLHVKGHQSKWDALFVRVVKGSQQPVDGRDQQFFFLQPVFSKLCGLQKILSLLDDQAQTIALRFYKT